jgi:hypothetical protein
MKLRNIDGLKDRRGKKASQFYVCGVPLVLGEASMKSIKMSSVPFRTASSEEAIELNAHDLFSHQNGKKNMRKKKISAPTAKKSRSRK